MVFGIGSHSASLILDHPSSSSIIQSPIRSILDCCRHNCNGFLELVRIQHLRFWDHPSSSFIIQCPSNTMILDSWARSHFPTKTTSKHVPIGLYILQLSPNNHLPTTTHGSQGVGVHPKIGIFRLNYWWPKTAKSSPLEPPRGADLGNLEIQPRIPAIGSGVIFKKKSGMVVGSRSMHNAGYCANTNIFITGRF